MPPKLPNSKIQSFHALWENCLDTQLCSFPWNFKSVYYNDEKKLTNNTGILILKSDSSVLLTSESAGDDTHEFGTFEAGK